MPQRETLRVLGYRDFLRACAKADPQTRQMLRRELKQAGETVRVDATRRFSPVNSRSASGYRTRVRQRGIAVQQSLRKTTGKHPEYGSRQMREALLPALMSNEDELRQEVERALGRICDDFERRP